MGLEYGPFRRDAACHLVPIPALISLSTGSARIHDGCSLEAREVGEALGLA